MFATSYKFEDQKLFYRHFQGWNVGIYTDTTPPSRPTKRKVSFWQFVVVSNDNPEGRQVGPIYATRQELLSDLRRYATSYGF